MTQYEEIKNSFPAFRGKPFRDHQHDIIDFAHNSRKKIVVVEAPTGIGKTLCGMVLCRLNEKSIYVVHSKALQEQTHADFPSVPLLWGRHNYPCAVNIGYMADTCSPKCTSRDMCHYWIAKKRAMKATACTLNYHYLLNDASHGLSFKNRRMIVVDEADSLESVLAGFINVSIPSSIISRYRLPVPKYKTAMSANGITDWKQWANDALGILDHEYNRLTSLIGDAETLTDYQINALKQRNAIDGHASRLSYFSQYVDSTWIYEYREERDRGRFTMEFKPTWIPPKLAKSILWDYAEKFVLLSATFPYLPVLAKLLGLSQGDIEYRQYPSIFPEENRQVKFAIAGNLVYKEMKTEVPKAIAKVKEIINDSKHKNEKGLIHTVSYNLATEIMRIGNKRLVSHLGDVSREKVIAEFKASKEPLILVSPSMDRGISLDDDLCRFIIWLKAPFLSMADKLVSSRLYSSCGLGNIWYKSAMLLSIVQGCGRGVRSMTDHSTTYLLDEQIRKAITENPNMVPKWFREAIW